MRRESTRILNSTTPASSSLIAAFEPQDKTFSKALSILTDAIAARAFPAASIAVAHQGRLVALKAMGNFAYPDDKGKAEDAPSKFRLGGDFLATPSTLFDVASLTKVVATTSMAAILYERGLLDLDAPVAAIIPEFLLTETKDPRCRDVTLRMLLAHSSGLPAYKKLFLKASTREELLHAAFTTPLSADPGSRAEYSDIGFITLGVALERLAAEPLDHFCQREVFGPLVMASTTFNPVIETRPQIPPTARVGDRIVQGEVQDENASVLGGVAGHAGLFATAEDLAKFAQAMLNGGQPILRPETVALFTRRESAPQGTSRALGWDTPSAPSQSGKYFGPTSYGHLGYTGTSLWIDPARQLSITLLTNRTWPDCSNQAIKQVRPKFHDAVIEALNKGTNNF